MKTIIATLIYIGLSVLTLLIISLLFWTYPSIIMKTIFSEEWALAGFIYLLYQIVLIFVAQEAVEL